MIIEHFHRLQLGKAKQYILDHLDEKIELEELAKESGASQYHFIRVFSAYLGETPFSYIRRERITRALSLLQSKDSSVTSIALEVGFETSSSFNKCFKKMLNYTPSEFRNLGKAEQDQIFYDVCMSPKIKEIGMNINLSEKPEVITRPETIIYSFKAEDNSFKEAAALAWQKFLPIVGGLKEDLSQSEFLGVTEVEDENYTYRAAISLPTNENAEISELVREVIPESRYARFILKGPYEGVWFAFDKAFKAINEGEYEFGNSPCLENYLNDPEVTPPEELITEILIPIK